MKESLIVFAKEIKDSLRDRRTLVTAVLMPIFLMPVIMIGTFKMQEVQMKKSEAQIPKIAFNIQADAPMLVNFLKNDKKYVVVADQTSDSAKAMMEKGDLNVYLEVAPTFEKMVSQGNPAEVKVYHKSSITDSVTAFQKVTIALQEFNQRTAVARLAQKNVPPAILTAILPTPVDFATAQERGGYFIGFLLPMFIVLFAIVGGMYIAIDVSAGEKERKTLEALLLTPASRFTIVTGKFLAVAATASTTIILSLFSLYAAFKFFPPNFGTGGEFIISLTPKAISIMLGVGVIMAIMFSGLLLSVAIFAKSYKEAQNYITPFYLLAILPVSIVSSIPGFKPTLPFFMIPGVNGVFVVKEVLLSQYDTTHILVTLGSLLVFAVIAIFIATKIYSREGVLFRD